MDRIKKMFESLEKNNYFKIENIPSNKIKEKIKEIKNNENIRF